MYYMLPIDEETGFVSRLRVNFKLCEIGRAPQAKAFNAGLVLNIGTDCYTQHTGWSGKIERVYGVIRIDITLPNNLDVNDKTVAWYPEIKTKPQFGKHSDAVKRDVQKLKFMRENSPEKIECTTWFGLKGELVKAI